MLAKVKWNWPQAATLIAAMAALAAVYVLSDDSQRGQLIDLVLGAWALIATFLKPLASKKTEEADA